MDSEQVSSDEARRDFRRLLNSVQHDSAHVTVLRYGEPAAVLVPAGWYEQARNLMDKDGEEHET